MNKGEGGSGVSGRDEDDTDGDQFMERVDAGFLLPFSGSCNLGRKPKEVAEETGYSMRTAHLLGVNNKGECFGRPGV